MHTPITSSEIIVQAMREENKTIARNTIYLYIRTFISVLVSLYTSRVLLEMLGIEDFGIYNLVGGIVALFAILRGFLVSSIQRYLNVEIGKGDRIQEAKILNISITINFALIFVVALLAETIGLWFVKTHLNIPEGKETLTVVVYHLTIATTLVSMLSTPYNALIVAHERMSVFAWITIFEVFSKLGITLSLAMFMTRLVSYSAMLLGLYSAILVFYYLYCYVKIKMGGYKYYPIKGNGEYKELLSFSAWTIVGNGASIARDQGISIIFNIFGGVVLNAAMGVVNQVSNIYSTLYANIQTAFAPQIIQNYDTDNARFRMLVQYCTLASFILMSFVCLPLISNADYILHLWLGDNVPEYAVVFTQLFMIKILIVSISQAVYQSLVAAGQIKEIQIGFVVLSASTLLLSWIMLKQGLSPSFAIINVILMDIVMLCLRIHYISKYTAVSSIDLLSFLWKPILGVLIIMVPIAFLFSTFKQDFLSFLVSAETLTLLNFALANISVDSSVRKMVYAKVKALIK